MRRQPRRNRLRAQDLPAGSVPAVLLEQHTKIRELFVLGPRNGSGTCGSGTEGVTGRPVYRTTQEAIMALSARDRRIISALEQEIELDDPRWARRFVGRHTDIDRPLNRGQRLRRRLAVTAISLVWLVAAGASAAREVWPWLAAMLAIGAATLLGRAARRHLRRRRYLRANAGRVRCATRRDEELEN
jgi:hypothetical protein